MGHPRLYYLKKRRLVLGLDVTTRNAHPHLDPTSPPTTFCTRSSLSPLVQIKRSLDFTWLPLLGSSFDTHLSPLFPIWMCSLFFPAIGYHHAPSATLTITQRPLLQ